MPCSAGGGWRTDQKIIRTSRSAEDFLHHAEKSTDRVTARRSLILTSHPPHNQAGQDRRKSLIFPEYSQLITGQDPSLVKATKTSIFPPEGMEWFCAEDTKFGERQGGSIDSQAGLYLRNHRCEEELVLVPNMEIPLAACGPAVHHAQAYHAPAPVYHKPHYGYE